MKKEEVYEVVNCKQLNVRKMPTKKSDIKTVLDQYEEVHLISKNGEWNKIKISDSEEGYVMSKYIEVKHG
jgi:uncharacterized protein YgiM (DUF1202 family)